MEGINHLYLAAFGIMVDAKTPRRTSGKDSNIYYQMRGQKLKVREINTLFLAS